MREDEFNSYAAARWPTLVRCLVLMGLPPHHAERVALRAVTDLRAAWRERDGWPDVDATTYALLVEALETGDPGDAGEPGAAAWWDQPADDVPGLDDLAPALDVLTVGDRWRLVLDGVAGLAPDQVEAVLGTAAPARGPSSDAVGRIAQAVPVGPVPAARVAELARRRRTRRVLAATGATVALLVVAGLVTVAVTGGDQATPEPDAAPSPSATATATPFRNRVDGGSVRAGRGTSPVAWYADGVVHLTSRTVRVPDVVTLTSAGTKVVAVTGAGNVELVAGDGTVRRIGLTRPHARVAADSGSGLVAWVDERTGNLVAVDTSGERQVVSERPAGDAQVVAVDAGRVYWFDEAGDHQSVGSVTTDLRGGDRLLDVAGGLVVVQVDDRHWEAQAVGYPDGVRAAGVGASISDDGRYVLSQDPDGTPVLVDLPVDLSVHLPLPERSAPVDAVLGPHDTATFVLQRSPVDDADYHDFQPPPQPPGYDLVTCSIPARRCLLDARLTRQPAAPLIAH